MRTPMIVALTPRSEMLAAEIATELIAAKRLSYRAKPGRIAYDLRRGLKMPRQPGEYHPLIMWRRAPNLRPKLQFRNFRKGKTSQTFITTVALGPDVIQRIAIVRHGRDIAEGQANRSSRVTWVRIANRDTAGGASGPVALQDFIAKFTN